MIPYRSVHFIGVLTPQMASLALFTAQNKIKVSGSDDHDQSIYLPPLLKAGVTFYDSFAQINVPRSTELVVLSPYYDSRHIEALNAQQHKIPIITATEYTKEISRDYRRLVVMDEYDGPLITSLLDTTLRQGHMAVNSLTHTVVGDNETETLAHHCESEWFALPLNGFKRDAGTYEADFLSFEAEIVILPSIRYNYPELNTTLDDVYQSYYRFVKSIPRKGLIIGNSDWSRMKRLRTHLADRHIETYGFDNDAAWRIREVVVEHDQTSFSLTNLNRTYGPFTIPAVGETMIYAAAAVIVAGCLLEMKPEVIARGLAQAPHFKRYYESHLDKDQRVIIDDLADHPDTIETVLRTVRSQFPDKKIWCLYEPGSYLRTKAMATELQEALSLADTVYLADIKGYPKEKSEGLHIRHFIADMKQSHAQTFYLDPGTNRAALLHDRVALHDCIVMLGVEGANQDAIRVLTEPAKSSREG